MRTTVQRLLSTVVLLTWLAPTLGTLGVGIHLALDHHGAEGAELAHEISGLARAMVHGHHHADEAAPEHDHDARIEGLFPGARSGPDLVMVISAPGHAVSALTGRVRLDRSSTPGSPDPLLIRCSLRL